jgi:hypothetical protein
VRQVKKKARQRLEEAGDWMAKELLRMATGRGASNIVQLNVFRDALERAKLNPRTAVKDCGQTLLIDPGRLTGIEGASRDLTKRSAQQTGLLAGDRATPPGVCPRQIHRHFHRIGSR